VEFRKPEVIPRKLDPTRQQAFIKAYDNLLNNLGSQPAQAGNDLAQPDMGDVRSPETYVGYDGAENFVSPGGAVEDDRHNYTMMSPRRRVGAVGRLDHRQAICGSQQGRWQHWCTGFTRATYIWCLALRRTIDRCGSASPSRARRPALATAPTSMPLGRAS
jgi:hypothetical protein